MVFKVPRCLPGRSRRGAADGAAEIRGRSRGQLQVGEPGQNRSEPVPNRYAKVVENVLFFARLVWRHVLPSYKSRKSSPICRTAKTHDFSRERLAKGSRLVMNFRRAEVARPGREKRKSGGDPRKSITSRRAGPERIRTGPESLCQSR